MCASSFWVVESYHTSRWRPLYLSLTCVGGRSLNVNNDQVHGKIKLNNNITPFEPFFLFFLGTFIFFAIYLWGVILILFVHNNGTTPRHIRWDPMCGLHPTMPWCCIIVVHCECFDNFSLFFAGTLEVDGCHRCLLFTCEKKKKKKKNFKLNKEKVFVRKEKNKGI
jgi:hypothetical protein